MKFHAFENISVTLPQRFLKNSLIESQFLMINVTAPTIPAIASPQTPALPMPDNIVLPAEVKAPDTFPNAFITPPIPLESLPKIVSTGPIATAIPPIVIIAFCVFSSSETNQLATFSTILKSGSMASKAAINAGAKASPTVIATSLNLLKSILSCDSVVAYL